MTVGERATDAVRLNPFRFKAAAAPVVPTGNTLVKFKQGVSASEAIKTLRRGNESIPVSSDYSASSYDLETVLADANAFIIERLGVAILRKDESVKQISAAQLKSSPQVQAMIPEFYVFSYSMSHLSEDDNITHEDTEEATWGVRAVGALNCSHSGRGIKIGVLDSGFDASHPDFKDRDIQFWSAYGASSADKDVHGHGTHCAGTAAGPIASFGQMRYGVAHEAQLRIYKVLDDSGTATDGAVLAGIDRALADGCVVLSMSFGRGAEGGTVPNVAYEDAARQALDDGCLFIAAAGNSSSRDLGYVAPIDYPANCPSVMAVGALDSRMNVANFSCGAPVGGSGVDIAGPGSGVFSSVPMPRKYRRLRGTSMAVPHVAGAACLWAEKDPVLRGRALWRALVQNARPLAIDKEHVGGGLVQAPFTER